VHRNLLRLNVDEGAAIDLLRGRIVAVVGYGNQGHAHALNLRDRGVTVVVGARAGAGADRARDDGWEVRTPGDAARDADLIIIALPDEIHAAVWTAEVLPAVKERAVVGFLHGLSVHRRWVIVPPENGVVLVAPKGPGIALRSRFLAGEGLPCLIAVHQEGSSGLGESFALSWAAGIGAARAAILKTTFAQETETDLFGEQAVLCGGMLALMRGAFETLVHAGFPPDLAYMECVQELKQVADLIYVHGPTGMAHRISNTAEFGAHAAIDVIDGPYLRQQFKAMLDQIRDGRFAQRLRDDADSGGRWLRARREALAAHAMEEAGRTVREWMPFLSGAPDRSSGR